MAEHCIRLCAHNLIKTINRNQPTDAVARIADGKRNARFFSVFMVPYHEFSEVEVGESKRCQSITDYACRPHRAGLSPSSIRPR